MDAPRERALFGQLLRTLRRSARLTQQDIADQLGIDRSTYAYYERGSSQPNQDCLKHIADIFGVSTDFLLGRSPRDVHPAVKDVLPLAENDPAAVSVLSRLPSDERTMLMWYRQLLTEEKAMLIQKLSTHCLSRR